MLSESGPVREVFPHNTEVVKCRNANLFFDNIPQRCYNKISIKLE